MTGKDGPPMTVYEADRQALARSGAKAALSFTGHFTPTNRQLHGVHVVRKKTIEPTHRAKADSLWSLVHLHDPVKKPATVIGPGDPDVGPLRNQEAVEAKRIGFDMEVARNERDHRRVRGVANFGSTHSMKEVLAENADVPEKTRLRTVYAESSKKLRREAERVGLASLQAPQRRFAVSPSLLHSSVGDQELALDVAQDPRMITSLSRTPAPRLAKESDSVLGGQSIARQSPEDEKHSTRTGSQARARRHLAASPVFGGTFSVATKASRRAEVMAPLAAAPTSIHPMAAHRIRRPTVRTAGDRLVRHPRAASADPGIMHRKPPAAHWQNGGNSIVMLT